MSATSYGRRSWGGSRDEEGHREFTLLTLVVTDDPLDGPSVVMNNTPGLPTPGSIWNFGNDLDMWAFCYPTMKVTIHQEKEGDPNRHWKVEQKFSTRPLKRCQDETIEDPLMEPDKISGGFIKYTLEADKDRNGDLITSSSHEEFKGPQVEFDANRPTVKIEQNVSDLGLATFSQMMDHVNDAALWGLPARCIKLSNATWSRNLYGTCNFYYTRAFEFNVMYETFDRYILDKGTKCLYGYWEPSANPPLWVTGTGANKNNPQHFIRFKDSHDNIARVILDGNGNPATSEATAGSILVEYYKEANFLTLGIPTSL